MTLDEAIEHEEEVAEINQAIADNTDDDNWMDIAQCEKCAAEHRQLAEWLKELKLLREQIRWVPVNERLPKKHGDYLVTIENGDVFNCYFNPDYCYDGYDNGAFTYTQEYFDHETMGSLGAEEFVFDGVVAWMSYKPYKAESEG